MPMGLKSGRKKIDFVKKQYRMIKYFMACKGFNRDENDYNKYRL